MKKLHSIFVLALTISFLFSIPVNSQDDPFEACKSQISSPFVINSQPLQAFLTGDEVAVFHTTFLSGSIYRIAACSGTEQPIIFSVYDSNHNLLFTNSDYQNAGVWDFKMAGSIECTIEAQLNTQEVSSGMALMYIGFKNLENE